MYNPRTYIAALISDVSLWMHLHYHHHYLLDWYPGKNNLLVTHNQKYIKLIMPQQLMWLQHTICNCPFHSSHWRRDREMGPHLSELEVEKDRKGRDWWKREVQLHSKAKVKGRDNIFHGCQQSKDSYANCTKMKCRALMYTLGCKGLVQIAHLYICESYKTMNTTNMESFCVAKIKPTRSEKTKPQNSNR